MHVCSCVCACVCACVAVPPCCRCRRQRERDCQGLTRLPPAHLPRPRQRRSQLPPFPKSALAADRQVCRVSACVSDTRALHAHLCPSQQRGPQVGKGQLAVVLKVMVRAQLLLRGTRGPHGAHTVMRMSLSNDDVRTAPKRHPRCLVRAQAVGSRATRHEGDEGATRMPHDAHEHTHEHTNTHTNTRTHTRTLLAT
jgi:hypothetical protein